MVQSSSKLLNVDTSTSNGSANLTFDETTQGLKLTRSEKAKSLAYHNIKYKLQHFQHSDSALRIFRMGI